MDRVVFLLKLLAAGVFGYFILWILLINRTMVHSRVSWKLNFDGGPTAALVSCISAIIVCATLIYFAVGAIEPDTEMPWLIIAACVGGIAAALRDIYIDFFKYRN